MGFTQAPGGEASRLSEPSTSLLPLDSHVPASRKKLAQGGPVFTLTREEPGLPVVGIGHSHGGEEVKGRKQNWSFNRDRERRVGRTCFVAHLKLIQPTLLLKLNPNLEVEREQVARLTAAGSNQPRLDGQNVEVAQSLQLKRE